MARSDLKGDAFIVNRIMDPTGVGHPVLSELPLAGAAALLLQLGRMQILGQAEATVLGRDMDPEQRCRISSAGFRVLERWPDSFVSFLDDVITRASGRADTRVAGSYGELHKWLINRSEPGLLPLKTAMVGHARQANPVNGRSKMFGARDLGSPKVTSTAAAAFAGMSKPETRRILEHLGRPILEGRGENWVAERSDVGLVREWALAHASRRVASAELGITVGMLKAVEKQGLLRAVLPGDRSRPAFFSRLDLQALVKQAAQAKLPVSSVQSVRGCCMTCGERTSRWTRWSRTF